MQVGIIPELQNSRLGSMIESLSRLLSGVLDGLCVRILIPPLSTLSLPHL